MRINITQGHIARGTRSSGWLCPVALAIKEQTGLSASVGSYSIGIWPKGDSPSKTYYWNSLQSNRIAEYDRTGEMEPWGFELPMEGLINA